MDKIKIIINNGETEVEVIRYFLLNNLNYLIYSLNEEDGQGYVKLYVVRIQKNDFGQNQAVTISNEEEWNNVKNVIKDIIKNSKTGNMSIEDLDYSSLNGLIVTENRVFKLSSQLVEMLGANKKEFTPITNNVEVEPTIEAAPISEDLTLDNQVINNTSYDNVTPSVSDTEIPSPTFEINPEPINNVEVTPIVNEPIMAEATFEQKPIFEAPSVDYQKLYEEEKRQNEILSSTISDLETKLESIKNILN